MNTAATLENNFKAMDLAQILSFLKENSPLIVGIYTDYSPVMMQYEHWLELLEANETDIEEYCYYLRDVGGNFVPDIAEMLKVFKNSIDGQCVGNLELYEQFLNMINAYNNELISA